MNSDMSSSSPQTPFPSRGVTNRPMDNLVTSTDRAGPGNSSDPIVISDAGPESDGEGYDSDDEITDSSSILSSSSQDNSHDNNITNAEDSSLGDPALQNGSALNSLPGVERTSSPPTELDLSPCPIIDGGY